MFPIVVFSVSMLLFGAVDSLPRYKINTRYGLSMKVMANLQNYVETLLLFRIEKYSKLKLGLFTGKFRLSTIVSPSITITFPVIHFLLGS